ncbi:1,2-beta-oligoglucan phosphorylase [Lactiplantibacillus mudanjiangensis]|uniref:GH36-type glycosyl hydrolase domain-containing protein n=1 Tax=Lactiplantibacillus mudanjiangensis TaxID=1296538 RepID=UPI0010152428|nr:1,2-beta-oligoglucan phosphorylase [Lactiplantibacillus mudanjiangensis]
MPVIQNEHLRFELLDNGAIGQILADGVMINQVVGNNLDGSMSNIYLRIKEDDQYFSQPLMGPHSTSKVNYSERSVSWSGRFKTIRYRLRLLLNDTTWFWTVNVDSETDIKADITYTQDLGLGMPEFVQSNEAFACQYLDHYVEQKNQQIVIASRQNQAQNGQYPYMQEGSLSPIKSFSTDGFQFFGSMFKQTQIPVGLLSADLENKNLQYECALTGLRTSEIVIGAKSQEVVFYGSFVANQPHGNQRVLISETTIQSLLAEIDVFKEASFNLLKPAVQIGNVLAGQTWDDNELRNRFPKTRQVEKRNGETLSFFTENGDHVVLPVKERQQTRQTGNIVLATTESVPGTKLMAATQFMPGVFQAHMVYGNTNMNVLSSFTRDALNYFKVNGTRIYIKRGSKYHLLGMPSAFVMAYDGADWYYQLADDVIHITSDAGATAQSLKLSFQSEKHRVYDILVTTQLQTDSLGLNPDLQFDARQIVVSPEKNTLMGLRNPSLGYVLDYRHYDGQLRTLGTEKILFGANIARPTNQLVAMYAETTQFSILTGLATEKVADFEVATIRMAHQQHIENLLQGFELSTTNPIKQDLVEQTNLILRWYTHDAMVHLMSPHGLEQYGGAAWGTRDVSQGPTEFFLATHQYQAVRAILVQLFSHQFIENGNWAQWFMFDEYADNFADESHGDVVVWPLKALSDYLVASHDTSILTEMLPYMSFETKALTIEQETLAEHVQREIAYIETHFLYDTAVSAYGDGDWDDTLQPADPLQKKQMASTWTEELTIETFRTAARAFESIPALASQFEKLATAMMADFRKYFMQGEVLPGFIRMDTHHKVTPLIYPGDPITKVNYRLLPLSQGVLSHILVDQEVPQALKVIKEQLLFPDGVRLMDQPSTYHGGVSVIFKRAEQSANFGREIGLLYVHAHIRYAAAMATTGDYQQAWKLLQLVNPIKLSDRVKNADLRQANTYFSSSDGGFDNRYQAQQQFDLLRTQQVEVKGGWRLYSSGPGIYTGTLLNDILQLQKETFNHGRKTCQVDFDPELNIRIGLDK